MMGHTHAVSGLTVGVAASMGLDVAGAPWAVQLIAVGVFGGAAVLPDLDHHGSTASRSLGPLTGLLSRGLDALSLWIYYATRTRKDPHREGGHRLITHTYLGCLGFGVVAALVVAAGPVATGVFCGLVIGLMAQSTKRTGERLLRFPLRILRRFLGLRLPVAFLFAAVSGSASWYVATLYPGWSWLYPAVVAVGCAIHREGDWCTSGGVPLRSWPRRRDGRRWAKDTAPVTFATGSATEVAVVLPLLCGAFGLASAFTLGVAGYAARTWGGAAPVVACVLFAMVCGVIGSRGARKAGR